MNERRHLHDPFENELCLIGAASDDALAREVQLLLHTLEHTPNLALRDVAFTLAHSARSMPSVLAIVAESIPDLCTRLYVAQTKLNDRAARIRDKAGMFYFRQRLRAGNRMVFLFPGETSQYPDMLRDLCLSFDVCREAFDEADAVCQDNKDGFLPSEWLFGSGASGRTEGGAQLNISMAGAIQCTHAASTALYRLFEALGIRPDAMLGHSGGEFVALEFSGAFGTLSTADRVRFLREGYNLTLGLSGRPDIPLHALLSVEDAPADWHAQLPEQWRNQATSIMFNGPRQTIVAVPDEAENEICEILRRNGARVGRLGLQRYYHLPVFAPAIEPLRAYLRRWIRRPPRIPLYSCLRADLLPEQLSSLVDVCVRQWCEPVRFGETVEKLYADGYRVFVELGARGNLSTRVADILGTRPHVAVATNRIHRPGLTQLHHALAILAAHGVALDATVLHRHRNSQLLDLRRPATSLRKARPEPIVILDGTLPEISAFAAPAPLTATAEVPDADTRATTTSIRQDNFGADFPLLVDAETISHEHGKHLELAKTFTTDDYPFIRDYALAAHRVSLGNPRLGGLPILSATTCIEIMAEAARRLIPNMRVVHVEDLRGKRVVTLEHNESRVLIHARRIEWPDPDQIAVHVTLRTPVPGQSFSIPTSEATVCLAQVMPAHETAKPAPLLNPRPANWTRPDIYPDRLFQGRILQSVSHVFQWGDDGLDYEIVVPARSDAVRATRFPLFSVWPLTMDGISSGIGLWHSLEKFNGALTLPFRARSIRFLTSIIPEGTRLRVYLRITAKNPRSYVADVMVSDGSGRLLLTAKGWEDLICPITPPVHRLMHRPSDTYLTQEMPPAMLGDSAVALRGSMVTRVPHRIFEHQHELWLKAVAFAILNPAERDEWLAMRGVATRRIEWLLGRACVKDALRRHLLEQHQQNWASTDIPIWTDDSGKPHALGAWQDRTRETIDISIAHTSGLVAAAIAVNSRIGIDLEQLGRDMGDDFSRSVFTPEEQELAAQSGEGPNTMLRFWCAKEALAKALGTGIRYSPSDLRTRAIDVSTGHIEIELAGQWLDAFRPLQGRTMPVSTALLEDHILATCIIPAAVLPPP